MPEIITPSQLKTITFVRHGQSTANAGGITMDHDAIPLSELGELQAKTLSKLLPDSASKILASHYLRAQQTARYYSDRIGISIEQHPLLHEFSTIDPSLLQGMNGEQRRPFVETYWTEPSIIKRMGEHAETFEEFHLRVAAFLPELQCLPANTVVFGHGMWIAMMIWQLQGFTTNDITGMKAFRRFQLGFPMPNCAVYQLTQSNSGNWALQVHEPIMRTLLGITRI
jgi:broad specificity phosphatase PhoE